MSGGGGGNRGNGVAAAAGVIPAAARKMVQNIKEIVNCTEAEIYAMLKECNMDPSEAIPRLLSQDTFHEVKSKREKKKETKDTPDIRSRAMTGNSVRGGRVGTERSGRGTSTLYNLNDSGATRAKPVQKKEFAESSVPMSNSASGAPGYSSRRPVNLNDSAYVDNTLKASGAADGISLLPSQPAMGSQSSWFGVPGRRSMADIVKMGRPPGKHAGSSTVATDSSYPSPGAVMPNISDQGIWPSVSSLPSGSNLDLHSSEDPATKVAEISHEFAAAVGQHNSHNDWSLVDESSVGNMLNVSQTSAVYGDPSSSSVMVPDGANLFLDPRSDELEVLEDTINGENPPAESIRPVSVPYMQLQVDNSDDNSYLEDDSLKSTYPSQGHDFEHHEVEDANLEISSATANLQQLSLHNEDLTAPNAKDNPAVIIPNHLQVTNAECSHLSFGSFGSGISAAFSGSLPSKHMTSNIDVAPLVNDASATDHSDVRNPEYYDNGQLATTELDENVVPTTAASVREYDTPSVSQPEIIRSDTLDATHGLQYNFPSVSAYALPSTSQPSATSYSIQQSNAQMQNLARFSSLMQPYGNAMPSNSLTAALQNVPNLDLPFSPLLTTQSMPTKYTTSMSSISGSTISMPEPAKEPAFSSPQPTQTFHSTNIASAPGLPQHLPVHPYSQPTLPLGHFANMVGYPYLPQSYAYLPSAAFQQAYTGNGAFHQSPTALHNAGIKYSVPQYKSNVSVTSLPQSAAVAPGYGGLGSSSNIPGNFIMNPSTASASTSISLEEAFLAQYREGNQYLHQQQNENPQLWLQGAGSRAVSSIPTSTLYNILGQNQLSGYRQVQQPSQFTNPGYPNFYHSQAVASQEHQQNPNDGNLNGSQGAPSQHSHQIWQHS